MIGPLDFSLSWTTLCALVIGVAFPAFLAVTARLPGLGGGRARQFAIAVAAMLSGWAALTTLAPSALDLAEIVTSLMILSAGALFYLEAWGLLSRGYTLGLVLTLYRAGRPLSEDELAQRYRGGTGLRWIMEHRLQGLIGAHLARRVNDTIILTPVLGVTVAVLFRLSLKALGLEPRA